jgi:hypothetical protein
MDKLIKSTSNEFLFIYFIFKLLQKFVDKSHGNFSYIFFVHHEYSLDLDLI